MAFKPETRTRRAKPASPLSTLSPAPLPHPGRGLVTAAALTAGMKTTTKAEALFSRFDALEVSLDLIRALRPVIAKARRGSRSEAEQLQDAANSIARNLAEGRRRLGRDRQHHWSIASGSADEVRNSMRISLANGWVDDEDVAEAMVLVDRVLAMTWRLTH